MLDRPRTAWPHRLDERVEHRLQIKGRAADDLEDIGGRGLLLQDSRSSLSSRVFSIAITAWAAKLLRSSICLSVNGSHLAVDTKAPSI